MYFAMYYTPGGNWKPEKSVTEQDRIKEHTEYMEQLDRNNIFVVGAFDGQCGGIECH